MKAVHFDAKTGKELEAHTVSGLTGFTSWHRLSEIFVRAGEIGKLEELLSFQVDERGITFRLQHKGKAREAG